MTFNAQEFNTLKVNGVELLAQIHSYPASASYWVVKKGFYNPKEESMNMDERPFVVFSQVIGGQGTNYKITNGKKTDYRDSLEMAALVAGEMAEGDTKCTSLKTTR